MTVSAKIELDRRNQKNDGTYPLKLLVVIDRRPIRIPLGYSIPECDWNEKNQTIKPSSKIVENITRLNAKFQKEKTQALEKITKLIDNGQLMGMSLPEIRSRLVGKAKVEPHLLEFFNTVITEEEIKRSVGNARVYKMVRDSISNFLKKKDVPKDIPLTHVTYKWLEKYELWFRSNGNSLNGLSVNLRTLRALLNRAIKREILSSESYPFKNYSIKNEVTQKRAVKLDRLEAIKEYQPATPNQQKAKDYFLISYYLMGISFVDLAFLQVKDIVDGRIKYKRKKGGRQYSIKITTPLQKLLDKYLDGKKEQDFIFNIIKEKVEKPLYTNVILKHGLIEYQVKGDDRVRRVNVTEAMKAMINEKQAGKEHQEFLQNLVFVEELKKQYRNIRDELKRYNDSMKVIGQACGVSHKVTSYVSRHSFATIAKFKGVPVSIISQALGHESLDTTETYLAEFDDEVMDRYNEMIIGE